MSRKISPPPDRNPRTPRLKPPPGACDCHFHIFGPQAIYPLHPSRKVDIEDSTFDDWQKMQAALGLSRGLLVGSGLHYFSYEHLLHWLSCAPERLRGVAIVPPGITDAELEVLTEAGVVGARFYPDPDLQPMVDRRIVARVHELGWHPHYLVRSAEQFMEWRDDMLASPGDFVIEHSGRPRPSDGLNSPQFRALLEMVDTGRCWIKLSPRFSAEKTLPFSDTLPFLHALIEHAPERMLWGSDWPHPNYFDPMPNDADLLDLMLEWAPDEAVRSRIFVDNPEKLFGFPPA